MGIFYKLLLPIVFFLIIAILNIDPVLAYACLVIATLLSLYLLNIIITPRTFNFLSTKAFLKSQADIYFIGSSRIFSTFNPDIIEEYTRGLSVYTFGNNSQNFTLSSYMVQELIKIHKPKIIFIDSYFIRNSYLKNTMMTETYYQAVLTALNRKQRKEFAKLYKNDDSPLSILKDILSYKESSSINLQSLMTNDNHMNINKGFLPITEYRDEPTPGYDFVPEDTKFKNIRTPKRKPIHSQYKREVLYLMKLAFDNDIKLFFIDIPIYSEDLSREVSSCEYSNYLSYFAKKTKQNIKVINLNKHIEDLDLNFDDFDDSLHLMESGSTAISHYIGEILEEYIITNIIN